MTLQSAVFDWLDAVSNPVFVLQAGRIVWANTAATVLTEYDCFDLRDTLFSDLLAPAWRSNPQELVTGDTELITARGKLVHVAVAPKTAEIDGEKVCVVTITPLLIRQGDTAQRESEERYRALFTQSNAFVTLIDLTGHYLLVNEKFATTMGYTVEEMIGRHVTEFMPAQEKNSSQFILEAIRVGSTIPLYERVFQRKDGTEFLGEIDTALVRSDDGAPRYIQSIIRDVTSKAATQKALIASEERYRIISELISDYAYAFRIEPDGTFIHEWITHESFERITGYTHEEVDAKGQFSLMHPDDVSHTPESIQRILRGESTTEEYRIITKSGEVRWMRIFRQPVWDDKEKRVVRMYGIAQDITEQKEAEEVLRLSEERYRIISELIFDYAYSVRIEPDGTMAHEWITDSFKRMTGFDYEEVDPATVGFALYHPDEEARIREARQRVINGETVTDKYRIITKSGELRWMEIVRRPVWDAQQQRVVRMYAVAQDITEQILSEQELRQNEEKYRLIAENVTDMITRTTVGGIRTYVSPVCRTLLGYEPEEMTGRLGSEIIHPDDMGATRTAWDAIENTLAPITFTCRMRHKDGHYIWFEVVSKALLSPGTNEISEYVAVARDISERKRMDALVMEQEHLRYALQKEQELNEVKSNLMRTISHEFRTPLALIVTSTDFLDMYFERLNAEQRKERLQAIRVQVKRLSDMLNDISFVVQGTLHHTNARMSMIALESYCQTILDEIGTTIGKRHHLIFESDHQLQQGVADKALIIRILSNLLSNAIKYSPEDSTITLRLAREGGDAVLTVSDEGIGIDPEEQKHIFEPFYRSSSVIDEVGGTGLGLSIVKDCVDLHHGTITVESALGRGTTFTIRLPQTLDEP